MKRREFLEITTGGLTTLALPRLHSRARAAIVSDVVVVGAGAFGGWTSLYLREMGRSVTMIDQYGPGNSRATSGGESRQIRAAYGDREIYTRWVLQAFDRWAAREAEWGRKLLFRTGQLSLARGWTKTLTDTKAVFDKLRIDYEIVRQPELARRFPQMTMEGIEFGMLVPGTGVLKAREGCIAVAQAFEKKGGRFLIAKAEPGQRSGPTLQDVALSTGERVAAGAFVFACCPWLAKVFPAVLSH